MRFFASLHSFVSALFQRSRVEQEMDEELRAHIRNRAADLERAGLSRTEAERQARIEFGGIEKTKEECRETSGVLFFETLFQDVQFALRMLRKSPGFTVAAVLTLALGIGANTAIFSVVNSVLLEPLRYPHPEELVALHQNAPGAAGLANFSEGLPLSPSMYFTYAEHNRTFQSLGVWIAANPSVTGAGEPEQVRAVYVSDGVLQSLHVPPQLGRWLAADDQMPQGPKRVMICYGYWQRRFGRSPSVIGRNITVDSVPHEIVGVMPKGFRVVNVDADLIVPLAFDRSKVILAQFGFQGIARLKSGVSISEANADIARMIPIWMHSWSNGPGTNPLFYETWKITAALRPLKQEVVGSVANVLWVVMATLGIVMLIVCANVANLFLVKVEGRQHELAIRAALGAPRHRIVQQLLLECLVLGMIGGVAGLLLAQEGLRLLFAIGPANLPRLNEISLGSRAPEFTLLLSLVASLLFGGIAVLKHSHTRTAADLRSDGRTLSVSRERHRARNILVVVQVAMALVLLVSAGLMIRTFQKLRKVDPGFADAAHLQLFRIAIPVVMVPDPQHVLRMQNDIADKLNAIPGVNSVGFASAMPMEGFAPIWDEIEVEGRSVPGDTTPPLYLYKYVSPYFFHTAGTRILAGRELTWTDVYNQRPVGLVSENLAREMWGTPTDALGKRFREFSGEPWREVVGVVQDIYENGVNKKPPEIVYWPSMVKNLFGPGGGLDAVRGMTFVVRSHRVGTQSFLSEVQRAVWSVNAALPLATVRTMQDVYDQSLAESSFALVMLGMAATMALALGLIGIYGVVSYVVGQRRHEIGIRMALGAGPADIRRMVLGQGGKLAAAGIAVGLLASLGLTKLMVSLLFGVSPTDPFTLAAVAVLLLSVVLMACWIPARRAMRVDPVTALRYE